MSREQFEAWYLDNWGHTEDHHETLFERSPDCPEDYYRLGVRLAHHSCLAATQQAGAKCAALAADNAGLKRKLEGTAEFCYSELPETTATDAFLAEVRASAADEACLKIINAIVNCYQDEQIGLDAAATICGDFAAQLRQDANTAELVAAGIITKVGE